MWFIAAILGYILLAVVFILDKKILTNEKQPPIVYTFLSSVFLIAAGLAWFFIPLNTDFVFWWVSGLSGLSFVAGLYWMFVAVSKSEASHIDPFIGAVITVATFFIARIFLGEELTSRQILGVFVLVVASVFLSFEKTKSRHIHWRWYGLGILAGISFAVSNVTSKFLYDSFDFLPGLVGSRFMAGVFGLLLILSPTVYRIFTQPKSKKTKKIKQPFGLVVVDKALGLAAILLLQWATALGSVTAVNALAGLQYALMFVMILALSRWRGNFLNEYTTKVEVLVQSFALLLVVIGLVLVLIV